MEKKSQKISKILIFSGEAVLLYFTINRSTLLFFMGSSFIRRIHLYPFITSVKPLPHYKLLLCFDNDEERIFDVSSYLDTGIFSELKDESKFKSIRVSFDSIEWENGADLDPEILYIDSIIATDKQY